MFKGTAAQDEDQEVDLTEILRYVTPQELQRYEHEDWKQEMGRETNRRKLGRPRKQPRSPNKGSVEAELPLGGQLGPKTRCKGSRKRSLDQTGFLVASAQHPASQSLPRTLGRPERTKNAPSTLSQDVMLLSDASRRQSSPLNAGPLPIFPTKDSSRAQSSRSRALPLSTETPPRASYSMVQTALSETESEAQGADDSRNWSERAMSSRDQSEEQHILISSSKPRSLLIKDGKSKSSTSNGETEQVNVKTTQFGKESINSAAPDHRSPDPDEDPPYSGRDILGQFQATNVRRLPLHDDSPVVLNQFQVTQVRSLAKMSQSKSGGSDKLPSQSSPPASWPASNFLPNSIRNSLKPKAIPPQPQLKSSAKGSFGGSAAPAPAGASSLLASRSTQTLQPCQQESSSPRQQNLSPSEPDSTAWPTTPSGQRELRKSITPHFPSAEILNKDKNTEPSYSSPFKSRGSHKINSNTARGPLRQRKSLITDGQHELRKSITPYFPSVGILNKDGNIKPSYSSSLKSRGSHEINSNAARNPLRQSRSLVTGELSLKHNTPDQANNRHAARASPTSTSTSASRAQSRRSQHAVKEDQQAAVWGKRRSPHAAASKISSKSAFGSASVSSKRASSKHLPHKDRRPTLLEERRRDSRPTSSKPDSTSGPLSSSPAAFREKLEDQELWRRELILPFESSDDGG